MAYVDGFVAAVPTADRAKYVKFAKKMAVLIKGYGALSVVDCWGDDVPEGKITSFPMAVKCKKDETVIFSWIIWPDKKTRNAGMKKMMTDPAMAAVPMPFDGKRLIFGGFKLVQEL